ncbi:MAG: hypothetical protein WD381_06855 [Balneolaceae bacterium]
MKTLITVLFFVFLSLNEMNFENDLSAVYLNKTYQIHCPSSHEKAEDDLRNYLSEDRTIESLTNYGVEVDHTTFENVYGLKNDFHSTECKNLIETFEWLREESDYSYAFFKDSDYYFIVKYKIVNDDKYIRETIIVISSDLEVISATVDFG